LGLAVLLALTSRLAGKLASLWGVRGDWLPLGTCAVVLAASAALPGIWVWSDDNRLGPFMTPQVAANLEQIPSDLKAIARHLADEPDLEERRIVCGEEVASFLTPLSRRFRFVVTRDGYTMYSVGRANGPAEAAERLYLVEALKQGPGFPRLPDESWKLIVRTAGGGADSPRPDPWPTLDGLPQLLDRYHADYAISSPALGDTPERNALRARIRGFMLTRNGFREVLKGSAYSLWKRARPDNGTGTLPTTEPGTDKAPSRRRDGG
jgi:hypothetical protein